MNEPIAGHFGCYLFGCVVSTIIVGGCVRPVASNVSSDTASVNVCNRELSRKWSALLRKPVGTLTQHEMMRLIYLVRPIPKSEESDYSIDDWRTLLSIACRLQQEELPIVMAAIGDYSLHYQTAFVSKIDTDAEWSKVTLLIRAMVNMRGITIGPDAEAELSAAKGIWNFVLVDGQNATTTLSSIPIDWTAPIPRLVVRRGVTGMSYYLADEEFQRLYERYGYRDNLAEILQRLGGVAKQ